MVDGRRDLNPYGISSEVAVLPLNYTHHRGRGLDVLAALAKDFDLLPPS